MKKNLLLFIGTILISFSSCNLFDDIFGRGKSDNIKAGSSIDLLSQEIGPGGGTITVNSPGDPLDGMEIVIEPNSFAGVTIFHISYAPIENHSLGQFFNPVSPLIKITCDGGFSDIPVKVKIPINLPAGHFAMGFFYDEKTGKLDGLAADSLDQDFIILSTRYFAPNSSLFKSAEKEESPSFATMVISSVLESQLSNQTIITSGFTPGTDDWEFPNFGSYISPGGHCAGQSISSIWYYYEKRLNGGEALFHRFDEYNEKNNPIALWQDNPLGYRFVSTVQEDCEFGRWVTSIQVKSYLGRSNWYAFLFSMMVTGEPQLAYIRQSIPNYAGHAVVVYKVNVSEGKLYIADPNFPNNRTLDKAGKETIRKIDFVNGGFAPYPSALNAASSPIMFDEIGYFAKTASINWSQISRRWTEFEAGTVGSDRFPEYELFLNSTAGLSLTNNMNVDTKDIDVVCKSTGCEKYISFTDNLQEFEIYDVTGKFISSATQANGGVARIKLKDGKNELGFYIKGKKDVSAYYVDFKWININYTTLYIQPDPLKGIANTDYTFYGRTNGSLPANSKFEWDFGDNTPKVIKNNDSTAIHKYEYPGDYIITLKLTDNAEKKEIGTAYSNVEIKNKYETLFIEPEHLYGEINKEYTFIARTNGDIPPDYKFVWGFGDGTPAQSKVKDSTITHTFTKDGDYYIIVSLYNNSTNTLINSKAADVTITAGLLAKLKASDRVSLDFIGDFKFSGWWDSNLNIAQFLMLQPGEYSLTWSGNSFNFNFYQSNKYYNGYNEEPGKAYGNMKAELSGDGTTILSLSGYQVIGNTLGTDSMFYKIDLSNLQYDYMTGDLIYFEVRGPGAASVVNDIEIRRNKFSGEPWNTWSESHLTSIDYNSSNIPILTVEFWPKSFF
jgi:hypothetical protein